MSAARDFRSLIADAAYARIQRLAEELTQAELETTHARLTLTQAIREAVGKGVSQSDVARAAGVSRQRIGQYIHGDKKPAKR